MGTFSTRDPRETSVIFSGYILTGFGEGTFVSIEPGADTATKWVGATGNTIFVFSADKSGTITVTLDQNSPDNAFLAACVADKVIAAIEVKDNNTGRVVAGGAQCTVAKLPNFTQAREVTTNSWGFIVAEMRTEG